jgi:hypothetical protein
VTVSQLVRLYPRAWRARYGEEFAEVLGDRGLTVQQTIDILAGAVDAWISPSVHAAARGSATGNGKGGSAMIQALRMKCSTRTARYTTRDSLISAGVLLGATIVMAVAGAAARRRGHDDLGMFLLSVAFPASVILSMPFALLKGQSRRSQVFFVLVPLAILAAFSSVSILI